MRRGDDSIDVDDEDEDGDELQKRARKTKWIDACDLFLFQVSVYMFRYPNSDRTHPVPACHL
jgi:hypothetical protein